MFCFTINARSRSKTSLKRPALDDSDPPHPPHAGGGCSGAGGTGSGGAAEGALGERKLRKVCRGTLLARHHTREILLERAYI